MSLITLAERLNNLANQANAHISEGEVVVTASNLLADATLQILGICRELGWACSVFDQEQTNTEEKYITEDFEPFRITIQKPENPPSTIYILTSAGFSQWLEKGHNASQWLIAGLSKPLTTISRIYAGWEYLGPATNLEASIETKSPRALVKEPGQSKIVPADIRPWLLIDETQHDFENKIHKAWSVKAFDATLHSLANEIDPEDYSLIFKGPPKLILKSPRSEENLSINITKYLFLNIQKAAHWVYENRRETEIKHLLLAIEIARSGQNTGPTSDYLEKNISTALESAKIAYQMSLSDLGKDTIKSLSDLRKAITEETAKATDATRQMVTAVSGALTVGIGLAAARISTDINPWLVTLAMSIATAYMVLVSYSGWSFIKIQRNLRKDWQPKLYRYLPEAEYEKMVSEPARQSEQTFKRSALWGSATVVAMFIGLTIFSFFGKTQSGVLEKTLAEPIKSTSETSAEAHTNANLHTPGTPPTYPTLQKNWLVPLVNPNNHYEAEKSTK